MGSSTERIAIDIQSSANVAGVSTARGELELFNKVFAETEQKTKNTTVAMQAAAKAVAEFRSAASSSGSGGAGGGASPLNNIPDLISRTNQQVDAMSPRLRTAASAFSRLAFEAGGFGGTAQGAVRSVGMLTYSLASLSSSAIVAASASGIGALAIVVSAGIGLWEDYGKKMESVSHRTDDLNEAHVRLLAQLKKNKLGIEEMDLNKAYSTKVAEIAKDAPGMLSRMYAEIMAGLGSATGNEYFTRLGFNAYGGLQATLAGQKGQADTNRKIAETIAKRDADEEARRQAEEAARRLAAAAQRAWDQAARFAAEDLTNNDVFIKKFSPAWNAMWQRFALDDTVRKETADIVKKMMQEPFADAANEIKSTATSGVAGGLAGLRNLQAQGPLLPGFKDTFKAQFDVVTKSTDTLGASLGKLTAHELPALASGFERAFASVAQGKNVFKALEQVALQSIEHVAAGMAASEFAQGIAMVARSIWDFLGPNPAAGASATQHFAAAGLFSALAGGAGLAGGGGGGSGGGGGGSAGSGNTFVPNGQPPGGNQTVIIQIGDVSNQALIQTVRYELNRSGILNKPIVVPNGRPS